LARNQGHFSLLNGAMFISSGALENAGILEVGNGSLLALLGNLTQTAGGQISGDGSVEAFFVNDGLVNPGRPVGVLTVGQDFVQTASGQVTIEIGGTNAGTQYDQLNVRNTAVFEGALQITLLNGFLPRPGDQFRIVNYNSHTGAFATIQGADLGPDIILFPSYQNDGLTLVAMPPQITFTAPVRTPDDFSFAFQTYAGLTYTVEYTDTLTPPDWQWLDQFVGDGSMVVIIDGFLYEPQRFYHVLVK